MNPEIQRSLWLEMTPSRLILLPLVLLSIILISPDRQQFSTSLYLFCVLSVLWGGRLAWGAIPKELQENTWDWQRMSALSPWTMAWGKLVGSTMIAWYASAICFAALFFLSSKNPYKVDTAAILAAVVGLALIVQCLAMMFSLQAVRRSGSASDRGSRSIGMIIATIIVGIFFFFLLSLLYTALYWLFSGQKKVISFPWFTIDIGARLISFVLISLYCFVAWALIGLLRSFRQQQQYKSGPLVWLAFVLFSLAYVSGFASAWEPYLRRDYQFLKDFAAPWLPTLFCYLLTSFPLAIGFVYASLFFEPKDPVEFRQFLSHLRSGRPASILLALPLWLLNLAIVLLFVVVLWAITPGRIVYLMNPVSTTVLLLIVLSYLFRDVALILTLSLTNGGKNAEAHSALVLLILYALLPGLLLSFKLEQASFYLMPFNPAALKLKFQFDWNILLAVTLLQAILAVALCVWRWRSSFAKPSFAPLPTDL